MAQKIAVQKSNLVQQAEDRLESAVARLEAAIQDTSTGKAPPDERIVVLEAELRDLKLQNANYRTVNDKIGGRLDRVINSLKLILE